MIWSFIMVGLLVAAAVAFGLAMAGIAMGLVVLMIPFFVFVVVGGVFAWRFFALFPGMMVLGLIVAFAAGSFAAGRTAHRVAQ
jgi:hypothetical protein